VLIEMYNAQLIGTWRRLKVCHNARCHEVFFDQSRNNSRTWFDIVVITLFSPDSWFSELGHFLVFVLLCSFFWRFPLDAHVSERRGRRAPGGCRAHAGPGIGRQRGGRRHGASHRSRRIASRAVAPRLEAIAISSPVQASGQCRALTLDG
jgi:hypothetical protein